MNLIRHSNNNNNQGRHWPQWSRRRSRYASTFLAHHPYL